MLVFRATSLLRLAIALTVAALVLSGCSLLPSITEPKFQGDALVGADTWSFTDMTLRPSLQQALHAKDVMDLLSGPIDDAGADLHHLPTPSGRVVDFEKDVLPHLDGEVAVGLTGTTDDPDFVVLIHTNDVEGMLGLLADDPRPHLTRDSRGVTRIDAASDRADVVGYKNWLVYATTDALRNQTLDRIDGKTEGNLATDSRYRAVVDRLVGDRLGFGYLNVSPLLEKAVTQQRRFATPVLEGRGRMAYAFGFENGPQPDVHVLGVRMEYIPDQPLNLGTRGAAGGDSLQAMDRLPKASILAFAGPDLGMYAETFGALSDDVDLASELDALLDQFTGPYAAGVTRPTLKPGAFDDASFDDVFSNLIGGIFFIAKLNPGADTSVLSDAIDEIATSAAEGDETQTWQHQVVVDNDWLALNAVPPAVSLENFPQDLLASDKQYQWVRSGFMRTGTNVYLDLGSLRTNLLAGLASDDELGVLVPFKAMGVSSQTDPAGDSHAHLTLLISGT